MIDPEAAKNAALVGAGAYLAKDLLKQALGPTADYIGEGLKKFTAKRIENIDRILRKFINKLGQRINEPGQVHPKLLRSVIADGSFCDDELTAEYYGGVLASSRTGFIRDDRGATYLAQISRLSTYEVRSHFIFYTVFRELFQGKKLNPERNENRQKMDTYITFSEYKSAMAFNENNEGQDDFISVCMDNVLTGHHNNGLLNRIVYGDPEYLINARPYGILTYPEDGIICKPTTAGITLYLWATGHGRIHIGNFLTSEITIELPEGIKIPTNAFAIQDEYIRQHNKSQQSKP